MDNLEALRAGHDGTHQPVEVVTKEISAAFKDPDGNWTGFSARARVLIVHKRLADKPDSLLAYTDPRWKGRAVIANPLFGTTTTQVGYAFRCMGR